MGGPNNPGGHAEVGGDQQSALQALLNALLEEIRAIRQAIEKIANK
jgi:hypothetical protein